MLQLNSTGVLLWLLVSSVVSAGGLILVRALLIRLPADYFSKYRHRSSIDAHPVLRWTVLVFKNIIGVVLVALGIIMSLPAVPGPGILTILVGIIVMDFPGKRRMEAWSIRRPRLLEAINRMRRRHGRPPLVVEMEEDKPDSKSS
jgi:hypothetical protein